MSENFTVPGGFRAGALVAGYRVESRIGAGGMAVVYRARDERLGRWIALKVIAPERTYDEEPGAALSRNPSLRHGLMTRTLSRCMRRARRAGCCTSRCVL